MSRTTLPTRRMAVSLCRPFVVVLCLLSCCVPVLASSIWGCVNQVSVSSYSDYLNNLLQTHNGDNRGNGTDHNGVRDAVAAQLRSFGLQTSIEHGTYSGTAYDNVVAIHQGSSRPNDLYIIGSHYDSANNPGADDDGSGVAGMLESARILSQYPSDATIIFIAFDREEQGLIGSYGYNVTHAGANVRGMLQLDMIAYNPAGVYHNQAYVYGRPASDPWRSNVATAVSTYGGLTMTVGGDLPYSDHAPFEARGYDATCLIERAWSTNPHYHRATDSVDTPNYIDYIYASNMTRGAVGFMADQAGTEAPEPGTLVLSGIALVGIVIRVRNRRRDATSDAA
jgi:hypothetical protein